MTNPNGRRPTQTMTMRNLAQKYPPPASPLTRIRCLDDFLAPLNHLARTSPNFLAKSAGHFESEGQGYEIPRYVFVGPKGGDNPIRIGIFAAIHGDEPAGAHAIVEFLALLEQNPEL